MKAFVVLSGCSGGGKSSLLAELSRRGYTTVEEPGRRVVKEEMESGGAALPWVDPIAFLSRVLELAVSDWNFAQTSEGWVFFDRGIIDAVTGLQYFTGKPAQEILHPAYEYYRRVFLTPPWPEIYATDSERRHDLSEALAEYNRLLVAYPLLGYEVSILPKVGIADRADFILQTLDQVSSPSKARLCRSRTAYTDALLPRPLI